MGPVAGRRTAGHWPSPPVAWSLRLLSDYAVRRWSRVRLARPVGGPAALTVSAQLASLGASEGPFNLAGARPAVHLRIAYLHAGTEPGFKPWRPEPDVW